MANGMGLSTGRSLAVLAALAALAYAPLLTIPLIEDDYPNLWMALDLGRPAGAVALLRNPVFQMRATSFWAMYALWGIARLAPWIYHLVSLLLHVANTWLVYAICLAWPRMRPAALVCDASNRSASAAIASPGFLSVPVMGSIFPGA